MEALTAAPEFQVAVAKMTARSWNSSPVPVPALPRSLGISAKSLRSVACLGSRGSEKPTWKARESLQGWLGGGGALAVCKFMEKK